MILAGDFGANDSVIGIFQKGESEDDDPILVGEVTAYITKNYSGLEEIIENFLHKHEDLKKDIYAACIGISGTVLGEHGRILGLPWGIITKQALCELLMRLSWNVADKNLCEKPAKRMPVVFINNLAAIDIGRLESQEKLVNVNPNSKEFDKQQTDENEFPANRALLSARWGLAEALLYWDRMEQKFQSLVSQGGHANFAPRNDLEIELLRYLLKQFNPVAIRDVLSEQGLVHIFQFFKDRENGQTPTGLEDLVNENRISDSASVIIESGLANENALCTQTLDLFVSILGAEAGNLALKNLALGGVYIGGTIAPKIIVDKVHGNAFMEAFTDRKNEMVRELISSIPVKLILSSQNRLYGAARRALDNELRGMIAYNQCKKS
ncbi:MAG: hypothetical protein DRR16_05915 [Candidatus Parabeggiatoa sp. nov. 3]|jgi:glucokinase|nr:MAG: hypothetical protein DRR00_32610 [Gammaproteobacteria bacterium]RKZ64218.1 MAG: hypothetical protein DRQ99_15845 [Gammaproteobacteria bacterium]RKZ88021.1 MAG: hypothetical protein DRR16_05915 [Gammaproteobacteria bacterium]